MGNTGSNKRDRLYSSGSDTGASPCKEDKAFEFCIGTRKGKLSHQSSQTSEEYDDVPAVFQDKVSDSSTGSTSTAPPPKPLFPSVFKWDGGGKEVFISGTFSDWKPIRMVESQGNFALICNVEEGEHQYKFQVDGHWMHSPNQTTVDNDMGTKNNLVSIKRSDYEVFQALADDISSSPAFCTSPPGPFSQEVPERKPSERCIGPPVLPPHLLEVILNKEVSLNIEPTLLPMPNHVMLNHLYALSIKDGVVVLSATLRFRQKYVTTLVHKPI